jgi:CRISPR/Cas system endoribonuclease Cas6 (RAMP superfamily)
MVLYYQNRLLRLDIAIQESSDTITSSQKCPDGEAVTVAPHTNQNPFKRKGSTANRTPQPNSVCQRLVRIMAEVKGGERTMAGPCRLINEDERLPRVRYATRVAAVAGAAKRGLLCRVRYGIYGNLPAGQHDSPGFIEPASGPMAEPGAPSAVFGRDRAL